MLVPVTLAAGVQQITMLADTSGFNFDSVTLTSPAGGTHSTAPATIVLAATASTTSGTIANVDFLAGSTLIGADTTAPFGGSWTNVAAGTYTLAAKATDSSGVTAMSSAVTVVVDSATPAALRI